MLTKKTYTKLLFPTTVVLLILLITIARLLWGWGNENPEPYSDIWETISGLGDWEESPIGFLYFQLWGILFGVFILHIVSYIHQRMMVYQDYPWTFGLPFADKLFLPITNKLKLSALNNIRRGTFFLLAGGIGFIIMGLIPSDVVTSIEKLHEISAGLGFGGIFFANMFYSRVTGQAANKNMMNKKLHVLLQALWWFLILGVVITYPIAEFYYKPLYDLGWYDPDWGLAGVPWIFSFSVWERVGFIVGCAYLGGMGWLLPAEIIRDSKISQ